MLYRSMKILLFSIVISEGRLIIFHKNNRFACEHMERLFLLCHTATSSTRQYRTCLFFFAVSPFVRYVHPNSGHSASPTNRE